jgi:hypothetical protein
MSWYNGNYLYRKKITVDYTKIDAGLADFPLTVILNSTNFDFTKARLDGYDVIFVASDDTTPLKFEREKYDDTGEKAVFHVKVPSVSSLANTELYMYFEYASAADQVDAANVWDADYELVSHMGSSLVDSTGNGVTLTNNGTTATSGKNGDARSFDGADDYIQTNLETKTFTALTLMMFGKADDTSLSHMMFWEGDVGGNGFGTTDERHLGFHYSTADTLTAYNEADGSTDEASVSFSDTVNYAAFFMTGENMTTSADIAVQATDGTPVTEDSSSASVTSNYDTDLRLGRPGTAERFYDGIMEEVRVSSISRVKAWRDAEFRSLNDELNTFAATEQVSRTESIVKDFIDELMVSATDTDRNISILSIATDQTRGTAQTIPESEKDQRLDRLVEPVLSIDDYGHKISLDLANTKIRYDIIVGVDRSDDVQFTEDFFNILEMSRHVSLSNYRNVVYMNGDGVSGEYGSASGLSRREISVTDSKLTTSDQLSDRADQELQGKYYKVESIQGTIRLAGNPFQYPDDFDLGDLVTVVFKGTEYTVQITEVEETRNGDKRDIQVTFGTPQRTLAKVIADMVN